MEHKNSWQLGEATGERAPHRIQHLLGRTQRLHRSRAVLKAESGPGMTATRSGRQHGACSSGHFGQPPSLRVTPANEQNRSQVAELAAAVQEATGENVEIAFVDQGYTREAPAKEAARHGVHLEVVKHTEAKKANRVLLILPILQHSSHSQAVPNEVSLVRTRSAGHASGRSACTISSDVGIADEI